MCMRHHASDPLSTVVSSTKTQIAASRAYYNSADRAFQARDVCINCGEGGTINFLLRLQQLEEHNKTGGRQCCPICVVCMGNGEKVITYQKKKPNKTKRGSQCTDRVPGLSYLAHEPINMWNGWQYIHGMWFFT